MTRAAAAMIIALAAAGCSTSPKLGKPAKFDVEDIRQEFERLSGHYCFAGRMQPMGGGGMTLRANGTFEYLHPSCTDAARKTVGSWHPAEGRIEFEPEFVASGVLQHSRPMRVEWVHLNPVKADGISDIPWVKFGLEIVGTDQSPALYPIDPAIRREIASKPTVWPMRKQRDSWR